MVDRSPTPILSIMKGKAEKSAAKKAVPSNTKGKAAVIAPRNFEGNDCKTSSAEQSP